MNILPKCQECNHHVCSNLQKRLPFQHLFPCHNHCFHIQRWQVHSTILKCCRLQIVGPDWQLHPHTKRYKHLAFFGISQQMQCQHREEPVIRKGKRRIKIKEFKMTRKISLLKENGDSSIGHRFADVLPFFGWGGSERKKK